MNLNIYYIVTIYNIVTNVIILVSRHKLNNSIVFYNVKFLNKSLLYEYVCIFFACSFSVHMKYYKYLLYSSLSPSHVTIGTC